MCARSRGGFNAVELAAVTFVVMLLVLALLPAIASKIIAVDVTPVGVRGRDIYMAITGANVEREPLGLPPLWPADRLPAIDDRPGETAMSSCSNSTDYFRWLYDEQGLEDKAWRPLATGFEYSKLAGLGVPACVNGPLTAENNMWTIAMNVTEQTAGIVPLMVTRNIDATSLASKVSDADGGKRLRFDPEWDQPFGATLFVMIRKSGAYFKVREKYADYRTMYLRQAFDANVDERGPTNALPLRYLTPTRTVTPGEQIYAEGAAREELQRRSASSRLRREYATLSKVAFPVLIWLMLVYVAATGGCGVRVPSLRPIACLVHDVAYGLFHFAAAASWACLLIFIALRGGEVSGLLLAVAVLTYAAGLAFEALWRYPRDAAARQRALKGMAAAPLMAVGCLPLVLLWWGFAS
jgi:hypothetical protein